MTGLPETVRNAWHLVALSRNIKAGKLQNVVVAGTPIALFRSNGKVAALLDRCPHRNYPLSQGRMINGEVECSYHGWRFNSEGDCTAVPGCLMESVNADRLAATLVRVVERHGGVFISLSNDEPAEPAFPAIFGDPAYDHFWWQQGTWEGRAFDAIENVLDPFHTNHLHHGFIRRRDKRLPVQLLVNSFGDGIEMVIEQTEPDLGLMSRFLEKDRSRSRTRYYPPTVVQAVWEGEKQLTLCVTAFFTPSTQYSFSPFACFTTPKGLAPRWMKEAAIRMFLKPVVAQDRRALAKQSAVMRAFNTPRFVEGPGDIMGSRLHRLWLGQKLEIGEDEPVDAYL